MRDVFLVAAGDHFAGLFDDWVKGSYAGKCNVTVVAAPDDADTADALRAVVPKLTSPTVTVVSGDLVTDMHLEDVLATHVRHAAVAGGGGGGGPPPPPPPPLFSLSPFPSIPLLSRA